MNVERGDVVFLYVPFTSQDGGKPRPALVVQSDALNATSRDTVLAIITGTTSRVASDPTQILVDLGTPEGRQSGLLKDSVVKCGHLLTVERGLIRRKIGDLPDEFMKLVSEKMKIALDL